MKHIALALAAALSISSLHAATPTDAQKWCDEASWAQGWTVKPHHTVNAAEFASQYARNTQVWDAAFRFLATNNLDSLPVGTYPIIDGRCWASVSEYEPKVENPGGIEEHHRFIDLQYTLSGYEKMGIAKDVKCEKPYSDKHDIAVHSSDNITYYPTTSDRFFLFFPSDYHQPSVRDNNAQLVKSRKVVVKIEYKGE